MCGRALLTLSSKLIKEVLADQYQVRQFTMDDYLPSYNISPGQKLLCVINDGHVNRAGLLDWLFVPSWSNHLKDGYKFINARGETVFEKVTFKKSFQSKRCLVIVDGFYEWQRHNHKKIPYRFYRENKAVFALAGIWNAYTTETTQYGLSLITTEANGLMAPIHHRMPVIIESKDISAWLDKNTPLDQLKVLMQPISDSFLTYDQVSEYVNASKNNDLQCIKKINV